MNMDIAHDVPGRLRLRLPAAAMADPSWLTQALQAEPGVTSVRANRAGRSVVVTYRGGAAERGAILALAGQSPALPVLADAARTPLPAPEPQAGLPRVLLAGAALAAVWLAPPPIRAVIAWANVADTLARGIGTLATGGVKVEVLDAIAVALPMLRGEYLTATFARFLLELGGYIEASTARRSDDLLAELLRATPKTVWIERDHDSRVVEVSYESLKGGEWVVVGAGQLVPVDGVVVSGSATVNQSAVTGESLPIPREPGDAVLSGSVLDDGRLVIVAERVGDASTMARIAHYIRDALGRPSQLQCASKRMADKRVMISLLSGAMVFAVTRDWRRLESVFLVDYSCAVKFGTPIAIKAAMHRAATAGCLFKSGQAIEALANVDTVVFDKTGTLTENTLEVTDIHSLAPGMDETALLALVASVAEHTSHPIAAAVVTLARQRRLAHITHEEVDFIIGHGVSSRVAGRVIRVGSRHYLEEDEGIPFVEAEAVAARLTAQGRAILYVSADGTPLGLIGLRDRVRAEAAATLERLRALGVDTVVMVTGDHREKAQQLAAELGIERVFYEKRPEDKAGIVEALKAEGRTVAFVGDGVNDGPALMAAHVGIAMPRAADIARATADVVLTVDRLDALADVRALALDTMALIRGNFRASVSINTGIMAGAAAGLLPPALTALLHNGTTVAILLRALNALQPLAHPGAGVRRISPP